LGAGSVMTQPPVPQGPIRNRPMESRWQNGKRELVRQMLLAVGILTGSRVGMVTLGVSESQSAAPSPLSEGCLYGEWLWRNAGWAVENGVRL
jgi:hypothetical protein